MIYRVVKYWPGIIKGFNGTPTLEEIVNSVNISKEKYNLNYSDVYYKYDN
ncbi:hypothetical protein [Spiroplasma gladiatoris]|nr:hypothetical protein [Spiroplasma gladiatoris]